MQALLSQGSQPSPSGLPSQRPTLRVRRAAAPQPVDVTAEAFVHAPVLADEVAREAAAQATASLDSAALLRGQKVVEISHNGFVYRLQATKLGKLILTK
ncbi:MAG: hemin transporter HemP [Variovorax sp.]|jgi:hemin uptake protein HemP|nr:hemin transporter HemP [Variovorax sp.]|eukprot:m.273330 g.273330  ORF g.273330 m.273330 type:complete len:99 (+) comp45826_c0_seq1:76-372(+)